MTFNLDFRNQEPDGFLGYLLVLFATYLMIVGGVKLCQESKRVKYLLFAIKEFVAAKRSKNINRPKKQGEIK